MMSEGPAASRGSSAGGGPCGHGGGRMGGCVDLAGELGMFASRLEPRQEFVERLGKRLSARFSRRWDCDGTGPSRLLLERVCHELWTLPPAEARALCLSFFTPRSLSEIAQAMGQSEEAVSVLVRRGLRGVRKGLETGLMET